MTQAGSLHNILMPVPLSYLLQLFVLLMAGDYSEAAEDAELLSRAWKVPALSKAWAWAWSSLHIVGPSGYVVWACLCQHHIQLILRAGAFISAPDYFGPRVGFKLGYLL